MRRRAACPWGEACQGKQHAQGDTACSGGHSMLRESNMPRGSSMLGGAAISGGHSMPKESNMPGKQHAQRDTACPGE
jgi:hypothetical protein